MTPMPEMREYIPLLTTIAIAGALSFVLVSAVKLLLSRIRKWLSKSGKPELKFLAALEGRLNFLLFFLMLLAPTVKHYLQIKAELVNLAGSIAIVALGLQLGLILDALVVYFLAKRAAKADDPARLTIFGTLSVLSRVVVWIVLALIVLDNLGFQVNTLIAGLGIGGIAVALAVQSTLGDLLNSLSIVLDRPFEVGDAITLPDGTVGRVEKLGIKSTRLRSVSGEQIIVPNSELSKGRISNFRRMNERRVIEQIGVVYQTPADLLEQLPQEIKKIIEQTPETRFERAHFRGFGSSSLDLEIVYYVLTADMVRYMDLKQQINLAILRRFAELKVDFAYPTQTLFIEKAVIDGR